MTLLPGSKIGIYLHSSLPDDLGIQYHSYREEKDIVGISKHMLLWPGLGHTSSNPFDDQQGWYRSWRGLCGSVGYNAKLKGWSINQHLVFPTGLREQVKMLLLCYEAAGGLKYTHVSPVPKTRKRLYSNNENEDIVTTTSSSSSSSSSSSGSTNNNNNPVPTYTALRTLPMHVLYHIMEYMVSNMCVYIYIYVSIHIKIYSYITTYITVIA